MLAVTAGCGGESEPPEDLPDIETNVNIVVNPGFEEWQGFKPAGWEIEHFSGEGDNVNFFGKSEKSATGEYSFFLRGLYNTDRWMVLTQTHPVRPGHKVVFSAAMMTENVEHEKGQEDNANIYVRFLDGDRERLNDRYYADMWTRRRTGTTGWSRNEKEIEAPEGARFVQIGLINRMTGHIYFDDVSLVIEEKLPWKTRETKFLVFHWFEERPFPGDAMEKQADFVERILDAVDVDEIDPKIGYYLYPDEETFKRILDRKKYKPAARWDRKQLHAVDTFNEHEMIHLALYDLGFPPVALAKGLVFHFRSLYHGWDLHIRTKRFLMQRRLPALHKTIHPDRWRTAQHAIVVPAWGSFVTWLIEKEGMEKFKELYKAVDHVEDEVAFTDRFADVYQRKFDVMDREWRLFLMRHEAPMAADSLPDTGLEEDMEGR